MKQGVALVFGASTNDTEAIRHLVQAMREDPPRVQTRREPIILRRDAGVSAQREMAARIAAIVRAQAVRATVLAAFAHRDCDDIEPAHEGAARDLEEALRRAGVETAIAATPAWAIEAWWFLWPAALHEICPSWRRPKVENKRVGLIPEVKHELIPALRPDRSGSRVPDYHESFSCRTFPANRSNESP